MILALVGAATCAGAAGVLIARALLREAARGRIRAAGTGPCSDDMGAGGYFRGGVRALRPFAEWLRIRVPGAAALAEDAVDVLARRGIAADGDAVLTLGISCAGAACIAVGLCTWSVFWGCVAAAGTVVAAAVTVSSLQAKDADALREQMPEVLRALSRCLQSGMTLEQTFTQIAGECEGQFATLFGDAARMLATGSGVEEALSHIRSHCGVPEMAFLAVALDVQHRTGGSMASVLEAAQKAVVGRLDLARQLKVQTAQARLSARVVTVLPFALLAVLSLMSPGFLDPLLGSAGGWAMLGFAVLLQAAGIAMVRRILREVA